MASASANHCKSQIYACVPHLSCMYIFVNSVTNISSFNLNYTIILSLDMFYVFDSCCQSVGLSSGYLWLGSHFPSHFHMAIFGHHGSELLLQPHSNCVLGESELNQSDTSCHPLCDLNVNGRVL